MFIFRRNKWRLRFQNTSIRYSLNRQGYSLWPKIIVAGYGWRSQQIELLFAFPAPLHQSECNGHLRGGSCSWKVMWVFSRRKIVSGCAFASDWSLNDCKFGPFGFPSVCIEQQWRGCERKAWTFQPIRSWLRELSKRTTRIIKVFVYVVKVVSYGVRWMLQNSIWWFPSQFQCRVGSCLLHCPHRQVQIHGCIPCTANPTKSFSSSSMDKPLENVDFLTFDPYMRRELLGGDHFI